MHTLLLADDSVTIQRVLALAVTGHPFEVVIAKDGQDAIDRMATVRPDLVLADTNMPCVDGYGVAEWVRRQPHLEGVPVLLLASALDPVDEQRFRMSGAAGVLEKPFEPTHVIDRVKELLGIRPSADSDGSRLVTPIKVIRPPDKTEPAPASAPAQIHPAPEAPIASPEPPLSPLESEISSREAESPLGTSDARPASEFESLLAAEQSGTGEEPRAEEESVGHDPAPPGGTSANDLPLPPGVSREMWDGLVARLEARLGLPDIRDDLQRSMTIAVSDAVTRSLREQVASEVAEVLRELRPALEQAVRESVASAMPAVVAQAAEGLRQDVQSQVASAVAAGMPAAMAEAAAGALGQSVRGIVLETSERLVKEEIARVRNKAIP
jgi:CheY-like chemotaxis protein